ncbi:ABC transporter permease [Leifsonia sp. F6_8S_P_1B]|uniref:Transport permease protein n=1 Tax=Leifsonia williamsii TaxID=3035919 RepID=A0ABT8KB57_9MICO|nr:ABC transporter permease [Leifsonia williamsii]MDN4614694.1 ABC transporter permease [Leifsonia williamsii]
MTAIASTPRTSTAPLDRTPSRLTATTVFIGRSVRHSLRNVEALTMAVVLPVMLMLLFTFVFGGALDEGGGYVDYVVPGIILLCAGFGASSTAVDVADDLGNGIVDRFRTMPLRAGGVITGHVVASLLRNLLATGVVIGVALLVGFRPTGGPLEWLAAIGVVALFILAITWLYAAIGIAANSPAAASGYGFALLFLPYLSSAFVPTDTMPEWLQWVAENQPITPIIETIRALLFGRDPGADLWWAIGWCALIIAGAYVWAAWLFRRASGRR